MFKGLKLRYSEAFIYFDETSIKVSLVTLSNLEIVTMLRRSFIKAISVTFSYFSRLANIIFWVEFLLKLSNTNDGKDLLLLCRAYRILSSNMTFLK